MFIRRSESRVFVGGAGSGKSSTIVEMISAGAVSPARTMVVVPHRAAAFRMQERIARSVGNGLIPDVLTLHGLAYRLVEQCDQDWAAGGVVVDAVQQDQYVRDILAASDELGLVWSLELAAWTGSPGFATALRQAIIALKRHGVLASEVAQIAEATGHADWRALATVMSAYLDVVDTTRQFDYSDITLRAANLIDRDDIAAQLRCRYDNILVDDLEEIDVAGVALLTRLAHRVAPVIAFGNPDHTLDGGLGGFRSPVRDFTVAVGSAGATVAVEQLNQSLTLPLAVRTVVDSCLMRTDALDTPSELRGVRVQGGNEVIDPEQNVQIRSYDTAEAAAERIADEIVTSLTSGDVRRYRDVAVVGRDSSHALVDVARALANRGVPFEFDEDRHPLADSRAVRQVVGLIRLARSAAGEWPVRVISEVLLAPRFGLDQWQVEHVLRWLSASGVAVGASDTESHPVLAQFSQLSALRSLVEDLVPLTRSAVGVGQLVARCIGELGYRDSELAHSKLVRSAAREVHDLADLLEQAMNFTEEYPGERGIEMFLSHVMDARLPVRRGANERLADAVTLTSAYNSRGRRWELVLVCDLQESRWPRTDTSQDYFGVVELMHELGCGFRTIRALDRERRLFAIACSRAARRLVLTHVVGDGGIASRFVHQAAQAVGAEIHHESGAGGLLTPVALAGELRTVLCDQQQDLVIRQGAARRLREMAAAGFTVADPHNWWGVRDWSPGQVPSSPHLVSLSGSSWAVLEACSLRWFLERDLGAGPAPGQAAKFGSMVHLAAESISSDPTLRSEDVIEHLQEVWPVMGHAADWLANHEFAEVVQAVRRFETWSRARGHRQLLGVEVPFRQPLEVGGTTVMVSGKIDRLEVDDDDHVHVVDLKTKRVLDSRAKVARDEQLSLYQLVVSDTKELSGERSVAGAELVQLRAAGSSDVKVQHQPAVDPNDVRERLAAAVDIIKSKNFRPTPTTANCRTCSFQSICPR